MYYNFVASNIHILNVNIYFLIVDVLTSIVSVLYFFHVCSLIQSVTSIFRTLYFLMMSQQSGDSFAALIRVNTVVQAVVGNMDIRGETRAEFQSRQEADINPKHEKQSRVKTQWSNRERWERSEMSAGAIQDFMMSVCECVLSRPIDEHQVN